MYGVAPDAMYGMELMDAAAAPSGTLYPILARYRDYGWLTAEREDIDPTEAGRPARTYYRLTGPVSYTHLRAHETVLDLVCRLLLEKKKQHSSPSSEASKSHPYVSVRLYVIPIAYPKIPYDHPYACCSLH